MSRKNARESAFKTIYEIPFHTDETPADIINFSSKSEEYKLNVKSDVDYFTNVTTLCFENLDSIDTKISVSLKGWTIDRISKVDLSILRLAICEIDYIDDIPYQVSINEAIELAKKFSDDDAPAFINGVLAASVSK